MKVGIEKVITNKWIVHTELNGKLLKLKPVQKLKKVLVRVPEINVFFNLLLRTFIRVLLV